MKIFDIDVPLYKFMSTLTNVLVLNFCWIVGTLICLGTSIGVSTVAAFDIGMKMVKEEEGYIVRQFIKSWKANFKQGFPLGLITLFALYVVYLDFEIISKTDASIFLMMAGILSAAIFITSLLWAYPLTARYVNTLPKILKNSFRISTRYFGRTVALILILFIEILAFAWNLTTWMIALLIGPASLILTVSLFAVPIFKKLEKAAEEAE